MDTLLTLSIQVWFPIGGRQRTPARMSRKRAARGQRLGVHAHRPCLQFLTFRAAGRHAFALGETVCGVYFLARNAGFRKRGLFLVERENLAAPVAYYPGDRGGDGVIEPNHASPRLCSIAEQGPYEDRLSGRYRDKLRGLKLPH